MYPEYHGRPVVRDLYNSGSQRDLSRAAAARYAQLEAVGATRSRRGARRSRHAFVAVLLRSFRGQSALRPPSSATSQSRSRS